MPVRRGHVAPPNIFIDTIIRKFDDQSEYICCLFISRAVCNSYLLYFYKYDIDIWNTIFFELSNDKQMYIIPRTYPYTRNNI